ncbi:hypothetical protein F4782DRAFT_46851 [Xylaria castorea]|nr:hypothetical protein F4782DRAFT_46851 [Xylaria castorea]
MADIISDFDFDFSDIKQESEEWKFDDIFPDVIVIEDFDPELEARLAKDYPVKEQPAPTSPPHPEAPVLTGPNPRPNDEICSQQQQFVNPQLTFNAPQPTYTSTGLIDANGLNIDWSLGQGQSDRMLAQDLDNTLAQDPIFAPQPLDTRGYSDYFSINQVNEQPVFHAQLVPNPINGQQMLHQQTMDQGYQVTWPLQLEPISQVIPQAMLQSMPQPNHLPMLQPILSMPEPMPPRLPSLIPQPRAPEMPPPPPHQRVHQPMPSRPIPKESLPPGTFKRIDRGADSFVPLNLRSSRNSRELPSAGTKTTSPPLKRPVKNHNGEALLNDRIPRKTHQNKGPGIVEPERYYGPSPPKPREWGPRDARGKYLFTYTEKGELAAGLYLTAREMRMYLLGPSPQDDAKNFAGPFRLPGVKLRTKKERQGLTLWVGWPAAMSNARYPRGGESTKCRFKNCPYRQRTIALGDPWVILDERQNDDGEAVDPFHNAGYVHLFCLESNFDIIDLWQCLDIRPDYRSFKRESHPYFCLAYRLSGIDVVVRDWWHAAFKDWELVRSHGMKRIRTHESSLAQSLVNHKLENETRAQVTNRLKRGGADISKHRGDPDIKRRLVTFRKHGLLDDNGWPVADADELLEDMQKSKRMRRSGDKSNPISTLDFLSPPLPVLDCGQQLHYPVQHVGMVSVNSRQPVYNTEPVYPVANLAHLGQPIPTNPYTLQAQNAPVTGHKRSWDDAILKVLKDTQMPNQAPSEPPTTTNQGMPFPKRPRYDIAPAYRPVAETLPTLTPTNMLDLFVPVGHAGAETQDELLGYYPENNTSTTWDPLIDYSVDIGLPNPEQELGDDDLDSLFGGRVAEATLDDGKLNDSVDGQVGSAEPAQEAPHEARANQSGIDSDNRDDPFRKPDEYQRSKTPSNPPGSPKAGGSLSPQPRLIPHASPMK